MSGLAKCMFLGSAVFETSTAIKSATSSVAVEKIRSLANVRIGSRLSALLEEVATAATLSTPGIIDQMDSIISEVGDIVLEITDAQRKTQNKINLQFSNWKAANGVADGLMSNAKDAVQNTTTCVSSERAILEEFQTDDSSGLATEVNECEAKDLVKDLSFSEPLFPTGGTVFNCDTEDDTIACSDGRVGEWSGGVTAQLEVMRDTISAQRGDWTMKKNRCEKRGSFDSQHTTCNGKKDAAKTAVCTFGDKLLTSCAAKATYLSTKFLTGESGNSDSNVDRRDEYSTAKLVACLAEKFKEHRDELADKVILQEQASDCQTTIAGDVTITLTFGAEDVLVVFPCAGGNAGIQGSDFIADVSGRVSLDSYAAGTDFQYTATQPPFDGCSA